MVSVVYGPVPSWRLGRSLGIDPTMLPKACTFDCVYCQLGRTVRRISSPKELDPVVEVDELIKELKSKIEKIGLDSIDFITFSGTGEPTLNPNLGEMISAIKTMVPSKPVAVLTNSSLLHLIEVRGALSKADLVCLKLDAADQLTFEAINRPVSNVPGIEKIIESIREFKKSYKGVLALQIMLIGSTKPSFRVNFRGEALDYLIDSIASIQPDQIQLNTPTRPVTEKHIKPVGPAILSVVEERIIEIAPKSEIMRVDKREISIKLMRKEKRSMDELRDEVLALLKRRPCRIIDISTALGVEPADIETILESMIRSGLLKDVKSKRGVYYVYIG